MVIMPAIIEVQKQQSTSPITITSKTGSHQSKSDDSCRTIKSLRVNKGRRSTSSPIM
jgi:hypothetical protein